MTEDIKGLIEKINQEGIRAAQDKAREIETQAKQKAQAIIEKAKKEADSIIQQAKEQTAKMQQSTNSLLQQAARDMVLSLRKEINIMLDRLVAASAKETLGPEELTKILSALIKECKGEEKIVVSLKKGDHEKLEKALLSELKEQAKKAIVLKSSDDIHAGFIISFDNEKSHFDFTDKALVEYIGNYLKPKLKEILKGAISNK